MPDLKQRKALGLMSFPLPETLHTRDGRPRRLGVELEFAGLELAQISGLVQECYGGTIHDDDPFVHRVEETPWGPFIIEIDASVLKDRGYAEYLNRIGIRLDSDLTRGRVEDFLAKAAATVVPMEIVTPPIPLTDLHRLEDLRAALQRMQARGTRASWVYAFGLHLNPEMSECTADNALAHLRAFLLLYDWLHVKGEIDWTRRLTPYIDPFPVPYRLMVIDPDYAPDCDQLVDDYLQYNTTRNRALDMLPIFRELVGDRAVAGLGESAHLVKSRPAFHYRLPNCRIDEPGWTLAGEYRGWVTVEWLAARPQVMKELADRLLHHPRPWVRGIDERWADICAEVLP
ncbi:hypothetical protein J2T57_003761 [Natronocella acetinitrilica]|uniref:Amidoligase enzyme n=1 Tax=Natronocella acetinitrilica TaxID=414046 RepID=A0AAE3G6C9_9GAMM|nr:amidoligase family protein [Natronocella acetinitrilica]MCP1676590.1 hypothetical protein [Natronocella acetinitrilica]